MIFKSFKLTPWLMKPGGSMSHSQRLSDNPYLEPNQHNSSNIYFYIRSNIAISLSLELAKYLFNVGLAIKSLKALLALSTLAP